MSYKLTVDESLEAALRRTALEQLHKAVDDLTKRSDSPDGIHEARKRLKKVRSLLRLGRTALEPKFRSEQNQTLRAVGHSLSDRRDAAALVESFGALFDSTGEDPDKFAEIRDALVSRRDAMRDAETERNAVQTATVSLRDSIAAFEHVSISGGGFRVISGGLKREYRRGKQALRAASREASDEAFHSFRKRAKDLWYHLRFLKPVWPKVLGGYAKEAKTLCDLLGDDHDLSVLHRTLVEQPEEFGSTEQREKLLRLIAERRNVLQRDALWRGHLLFDEPIKVHIGRLRSAYQAWKQRTKAGRPATAAS